MTEQPRPDFLYEEHPDHPGWMRWGFRDNSRYTGFLGEMIVRADDGVARVRMTPEHRHSNLSGVMHGGALLGFIDVSLFAAARSLGLITAGTAVTLDLNTHFIGGARIDTMVEARVELLKETGRLLFLRGLLCQGEDIAAEFSGTIRKPSPGKTSVHRA